MYFWNAAFSAAAASGVSMLKTGPVVLRKTTAAYFASEASLNTLDSFVSTTSKSPNPAPKPFSIMTPVGIESCTNSIVRVKTSTLKCPLAASGTSGWGTMAASTRGCHSKHRPPLLRLHAGCAQRYLARRSRTPCWRWYAATLAPDLRLRATDRPWQAPHLPPHPVSNNVESANRRRAESLMNVLQLLNVRGPMVLIMDDALRFGSRARDRRLAACGLSGNDARKRRAKSTAAGRLPDFKSACTRRYVASGDKCPWGNSN